MADFGYYPGVTRMAEDDANSGANYKTQINGNASANVKGSWAVCAASTGFDSDILMVHVQGSGGAWTALIDIGVGGAGVETVLISNICSESQSSYLHHDAHYFPIYIPAGTRVTARCQTSTGSKDFYVKLHFIASNGTIPCRSAVTYGAVTGTSRGFLTQCAVTANTYGITYYQITAATTADFSHAVVLLQCDQNNGDQDVAIQLYVGAASSEVLAIPDLYLESGNATLSSSLPGSFSFPWNVPSGTRISARGRSSAGGMNIDIVIIGLL